MLTGQQGMAQNGDWKKSKLSNDEKLQHKVHIERLGIPWHTPIDAQMKLSSTARTHKQQGLMARQQPWTRVSRSVIILASLQGKTLHVRFRAMWVVLTLPVSAIVAAESPRLVVRYPMCIDMRISYVFCFKAIYMYINIYNTNRI